MDRVYQEMKGLYLEYYIETRSQERMIEICDYENLEGSIERRRKIIRKINALDIRHLTGKGEEVNEIIRMTIELEKKNNLIMAAALTDLRIKMKAFRNKKNNMMRYSANV